MRRFLPARLWAPVAYLGAVGARVGDLNLGLIAAGVAFYGLLAIFPTLTAIVALWGLVSDPELVAAQATAVEPMLPEGAFEIVDAQLQGLASGAPSTLGWATGASLLAALWASRSGVGALIGGLNAVHGLTARGGVVHAATALALTAALIVAALVALAAVVVAPVALALLPLGPYAGLALDVLRWVIGIVVVLGAVGLLYRFGPNGRAAPGAPRRWGLVTPGAVTAVALWGAASWGFSTYLANFGSYDRVYGSLGAVIALLMWFWLSAYVVLLGAILDAETSARRAPAPPGDPAPAA